MTNEELDGLIERLDHTHEWYENNQGPGPSLSGDAAAALRELRARLAERLTAYCVCRGVASPVEGCDCVCCTTERLRTERDVLSTVIHNLVDRLATDFRDY